MHGKEEIKEIEIEEDELSDAVPVELMEANGVELDFGTVYEIDNVTLGSNVGSYGRPRMSSGFGSVLSNMRRRIPRKSIHGKRRFFQRSMPPLNNDSSDEEETASLDEVVNVNPYSNSFFNGISRIYNSFCPAQNATNNPRYAGRPKTYNEKSYYEHWKSFFFYGLNESGALVPWVLFLLFLPSMLNIQFFGFATIFSSIAWIYILLGIPELLGFIFAQGLRRLGPLNMYPFEVGAIKISPYIHDWKLRVHLVVLDGKFGNPPNFPFPYFFECGRLDMEASVSFQDIGRSLMLKKKKAPLSKVPDFEYFLKFDFEHVEVCDAQVNFQMYDGRFNINEFTRLLAEGEANHVLKSDPFPNQLHVTIYRAKNLKPHRLKRSIDPYVLVKLRRNSKQTATQTETLNPMFNEKLIFNLDDPSVVMEICVFDRDSPDGSQAAFIGHWAMTTKYLICNPEYNFHIPEDYITYKHSNLSRPKVFGKRKGEEEYDSDEDLENFIEPDEGVEEVSAKASYKKLGFRGWIPLAAKNWEQIGDRGQLEVKIVWKHVQPQLLRRDSFEEKKKYTALEQLKQQSAEDQLRFGAWSRLKEWLNHEPFCYDIKRFTIRRTKFYLQDLFRGHKGNEESRLGKVTRNLKRKQKPRLTEIDILDNQNEENDEHMPIGNMSEIKVAKNSSGHIPIQFMEMTQRFRPKKGDIGVTTYHIFLNFFVGLVFEFARKGKTGRAISEIMSGGLFNLKSSIANVVKGESSVTVLEGMERLLKQTSAGFQIMHQKVTVNKLNAVRFRFPVDAYDNDFLLGPEDIEVNGYLDRCAVKVSKGQVSKEKMIKIAKSWKLKFKTKYFEIKGNTLFYRRQEAFRQGKVYHLTYKLSLYDVQGVLYSASNQVIVLNVEMHNHCVVLRIPKNAPGRVRSLQKWLSVFAEHEIPCSEHNV